MCIVPVNRKIIYIVIRDMCIVPDNRKINYSLTRDMSIVPVKQVNMGNFIDQLIPKKILRKVIFEAIIPSTLIMYTFVLNMTLISPKLYKLWPNKD